MLVFDQKLTTQKVLGELDGRGVRFMTLRMRSASLMAHIDGPDPKAWRTVSLDRDGSYRKPQVVDLDVVLSVLAGTTCAALRRRLRGYAAAAADTLQRRFLSTAGLISGATTPSPSA
jgi:hypothetical protein